MSSDDLTYIGDSVPLQFEAKMYGKGNQNILPVQATVSIYNESGEIIRDDPCNIIGSDVSYVLEPPYTRRSGDYVAIFMVHFGSGQEMRKAHPVRFSVLPRGIDPIIEGKPVETLNETSTPQEAETAINRTLRQTRKAGSTDGAKATIEAAQLKTKRKIEH